MLLILKKKIVKNEEERKYDNCNKNVHQLILISQSGTNDYTSDLFIVVIVNGYMSGCLSGDLSIQ